MFQVCCMWSEAVIYVVSTAVPRLSEQLPPKDSQSSRQRKQRREEVSVSPFSCRLQETYVTSAHVSLTNEST